MSVAELIEIKHFDGLRYHISDKSVIIGRTPQMLELYKAINALANFRDINVLIQGESGTGKELVAKALHYNNYAHIGNGDLYKTINCTSMPDTLFESELFGHERGAFTGAAFKKKGLIEEADKGTVFFDEIGDMPLLLQPKILRLLQEREIRAVGSNKTRKVDFRFVAATNKTLEKEIEKGRFREDLFYRISEYTLHIPPLRERKEDIVDIAEYFIGIFNQRYNLQIEGLSETAKEKLLEYNWPGNVRELSSVVKRCFVNKRDGLIEEQDVDLNNLKRNAINTGLERKVEEEKRVELIEEPKLQDVSTENKKWFEDGVLPIAAFELSKIPFAIDYDNVKKLIQSNCVYSKNLWTPRNPFMILFLTPENTAKFFLNTKNRYYEELIDKINNSDFNEIAKQPFIMYDLKKIKDAPYLINDHYKIQARIKEINPFVISKYGRQITYAFTENQAAQLISTYQMSAKEAYLKLKIEITSEYNQFCNWKP